MRLESRRLQLLAVLLLASVAAAAEGLLAPASVNGDGIGYLKQVQTSELSPGHLAYLPVARAVARVARPAAPLDLVAPLRALSMLAAAAGLGLFFLCARRLWPPRAAIFCTALLTASHAYLRAGQEVEVYGLATLSAIAVLTALVYYGSDRRSDTGGPRLRWALCLGLAGGLAPTFHLTLALLTLPALGLLWWSGRRWRHVALAAGVAAALGLSLLLLALHAEGIESMGQAWRWLRSSDHGIAYPLSPATPLIALWGLAKSLVAVPYLYEASAPRVVLQSALAAGAWIALVLLARRGARAGKHPAALGAGFVAVLVGPLAAFGVLFYPSDTERWVLLLPAICLLLGGAAGRPGVGIVTLVALFNLGVRVPAALDRGELALARRTDGLLTASDLVVSPGHGWTELVGLASRAPAARFPLVYHAGTARDLARAQAMMHRRIRETFARKGRVFVARLRDRTDRRGFKELQRSFGLSPAAFARGFERYRPVPTAVPQLWRLSRPEAVRRP